MASNLDLKPGHDTISDVFRALVKRSGKELTQIIEETKLPSTTVYSLHNRTLLLNCKKTYQTKICRGGQKIWLKA